MSKLESSRGLCKHGLREQKEVQDKLAIEWSTANRLNNSARLAITKFLLTLINYVTEGRWILLTFCSIVTSTAISTTYHAPSIGLHDKDLNRSLGGNHKTYA